MGVTVAATGGAVALQENSGSTDFGQSVYTTERGDTVELGIEFDDTDTATVQVGDPDDDNYYVSAQVEDTDGDGEAVVTFDSETAGSDQQVLSAADDDTVANVTQGGQFDGMNEPAGSDILDATNYDLYVTAGEKSSDRIGSADADVATLSLQQSGYEPPTASFENNMYSADRGDTVDITVEFDDTNTSTVQVGDPDDSYYVTAQVEDTDGDGEAVVTFDSETAGSDQQVLAASDGDDVTNVTQGGSFDGSNDPAGSDVLDAADYDLSVTAGETSSDQITDPDAGATLTLSEADSETSLDYEGDTLTVQNAPDQTISGNTTLDAGTELAVSIVSTTDTDPFVHQPEATVQDDGSFTVTQDFSSAEPGTEFEVTVLDGDTELTTAEGQVAGDEADPDDGTEDGTDGRSGLSLTATSNPTLDGTVRVQFTVENTGTETAAVTVNASDVVAPDALSLSDHTSEGGVWRASTQTWLFQNLAPGQSVTAAVDVTVDSNASEQPVTGIANGNRQEVSATVTVDRDGLSMVQAVDSNDDDQLDDSEVVQAINSWRNDETLGGSNRTITDGDILDIINLWQQGGA